MNLTPIPKLDELAETPAKAKDLPSDVRQALVFRALTVLNALHAAGLADGHGPRIGVLGDGRND